MTERDGETRRKLVSRRTEIDKQVRGQGEGSLDLQVNSSGCQCDADNDDVE